MPIKSINGESIVVDASGISDGAVSSKSLEQALGMRIDAHDDALIWEDQDSLLAWQQGGINGNTGGTTNMNQSNRVRTTYIELPTYSALLRIEIPSTMKVQAYDYISSSYQGKVLTSTSGGPLYISVTSGHRYRIMLQRYDNADVSYEDSVLDDVHISSAKDADYYFGRCMKSGYTLVGTDNYSELLPDCDTATVNTSYVIASGMGNYIDNMPPSKSAGVLVTFSGRNTLSGCMQLYADAYADSGGKKNLWYRQNWGNLPNVTWSEWRSVSFDGDVRDTADFTDVSMYQRIGVLGDSYCTGSLYLASDDKRSNYNLAWGAQLGRQHGIGFVPYAVGGWGAWNFLNADGESYNTYGAGRFLQDVQDPDKVCGLYVIAYGINDSNPSKTFGGKTGGPTYIGSSEDIDDEDWRNNANSYWGNMSKIISMIKENAPDALIVLTTLARFGTSRYDDYSAEIPAIAAYNNVRYIDLLEDPFFTSDYFTHLSYDHPTAQLYAGMARAISRLIQRDMVANWQYYQYFRGINNPR